MSRTAAIAAFLVGALVAVVAALTLAGGDGGGSDSGRALDLGAGLPACRDVFVEGRAVSDAEWEEGCVAADGDVVLAISLGYDCGTLWNSPLGWGYGGRAFHAGDGPPPLTGRCDEG